MTTADEEQKTVRNARVTWASQIEPEPVVWAWADRIPAGSLSVAAGREGTGKSSFGIWLAAQITCGRLPGSFAGTPRPVLYVAVEDSWKHTLVPRLMAAGADLGRVGRFDVVNFDGEELALSLPVDNALFEEAVTGNGVALVVIDPLMSVIGERIDTHRERDTRQALDPLVRIADRAGAVVLGIAHFNKGSGADPASLITGSGAFKNVPRSVFGFARDDSAEDGTRILTQVKNSLGNDSLPSLTYIIESATIDTRKGPTTTGRFKFTGESERTVTDVLRDSRGGMDGDDRHEASVWLIDYLSTQGGEAPARDIYRAGRGEGFSQDALKRAKGKEVKSVKAGMNGGWVWRLVADSAEGSTEGSEGSPVPNPAPFAPFVRPSEDSTETSDGTSEAEHPPLALVATEPTPAPAPASPQAGATRPARPEWANVSLFDTPTENPALSPSNILTDRNPATELGTEKCPDCAEPRGARGLTTRCRTKFHTPGGRTA